MSDITDKEFEKIYLPFYNNINDYLNNYVIPDLVAFYLANAYSRHCLSECNLINHINSAIDVFVSESISIDPTSFGVVSFE